ncbi:hypothetical protein ACT009_15485 [Sphingomonas sp. Tas61C01]|uniref:hypothetical protein n=1 Tax=Sphingomonas sp. Tas61C01 TaxID=3458297 RepID=UPI00403E9929
MNAPLDTTRSQPVDPTMAVITASRRGDGWTGERQRAFCEALAQGDSVAAACRSLGLSIASAYAFRSSARGAAFAIGWSAAQLLQRHRLADELATRALEGQTVTTTHRDGTVVERHVFDNRLAMAILTRLDRRAAEADIGASDSSGVDGHAARLAAGEFDRYLDLLAADAAPARAAMFVALRGADATGRADLDAIARLGRADLYVRVGAGVAAEVDIADLDIAARVGWTAEQWARAEAAGLVSIDAPPAAPPAAPPPAKPPTDPQLIQHSPAPPPAAWENVRVWEDYDGWRTDFPPPPQFGGKEFGRYGEEGYERGLSDEEADLLDWRMQAERDELARADEPARAAWLDSLALPEEPRRPTPD